MPEGRSDLSPAFLEDETNARTDQKAARTLELYELESQIASLKSSFQILEAGRLNEIEATNAKLFAALEKEKKKTKNARTNLH